MFQWITEYPIQVSFLHTSSQNIRMILVEIFNGALLLIEINYTLQMCDIPFPCWHLVLNIYQRHFYKRLYVRMIHYPHTNQHKKWYWLKENKP